jgi:hypothetical protein
MTYQVERIDTGREGMGHYRYRVVRDGHLIVHYWCDIRDHQHGLQHLNGTVDVWSGSYMQDFLEDNAPHGLKLSETAIAYLEQRLK